MGSIGLGACLHTYDTEYEFTDFFEICFRIFSNNFLQNIFLGKRRFCFCIYQFCLDSVPANFVACGLKMTALFK